MADILKSYNDVTRRNVDMGDGTWAEKIVADATVSGPDAQNTAVTGNPILTGVVALSANPTAVVNNRIARQIGTLIGVQITRPYSIPEADWAYAAAAGGILNTTTGVLFKVAGGAGIRNYLTSVHVHSEPLTNATELVIRDGTGGTIIWRIKIPTTGMVPVSFTFQSPLRGSLNAGFEVQTLTASGAGAVYFNAHGYSAP